jgi:hypothetical protein
MGKLAGTPFLEVFPVFGGFLNIFPLRRFGTPKEEEDERLIFFPTVDPVAWAIIYM